MNSSEYIITETVIELKMYRKRNILFMFKGLGVETLNCIFESTDSRRFK
jgi:hypothetical protein